MKTFIDIDHYIESFPKDKQKILQKIRQIAKKVVKNGEESIRYGIPTIRLNGKNLIHFAAFKNHIGFYPTPRAIIKFDSELKPYKKSKGTIQFPYNQTIPFELIEKMIEHRLKEISKK